MPSITITVSEAQATRVENALCKIFNYEVTPANTKKAIVNLVKEAVVAQEKREESIEAPTEVT